MYVLSLSLPRFLTLFLPFLPLSLPPSVSLCFSFSSPLPWPPIRPRAQFALSFFNGNNLSIHLFRTVYVPLVAFRPNARCVVSRGARIMRADFCGYAPPVGPSSRGSPRQRARENFRSARIMSADFCGYAPPVGPSSSSSRGSSSARALKFSQRANNARRFLQIRTACRPVVKGLVVSARVKFFAARRRISRRIMRANFCEYAPPGGPSSSSSRGSSRQRAR